MLQFSAPKLAKLSHTCWKLQKIISATFLVPSTVTSSMHNNSYITPILCKYFLSLFTNWTTEPLNQNLQWGTEIHQPISSTPAGISSFHKNHLIGFWCNCPSIVISNLSGLGNSMPSQTNLYEYPHATKSIIGESLGKHNYKQEWKINK